MTHSGRKGSSGTSRRSSSPRDEKGSLGSDLEDKTPLTTPSSSSHHATSARGGGERAYSPVAETVRTQPDTR
ncbi:Hypothetical protein FKW44_018740 [Caligus rogercresseyi]|uniref:Uncharacterized protein n=1 Tax=Caligus rogercresseyi TaxID=217165 RepID=A0A7T8GUT9_CALRO|nr:Hypothetical protein FKW44_018740 [Caligus rogercresseyi]